MSEHEVFEITSESSDAPPTVHGEYARAPRPADTFDASSGSEDGGSGSGSYGSELDGDYVEEDLDSDGPREDDSSDGGSVSSDDGSVDDGESLGDEDSEDEDEDEEDDTSASSDPFSPDFVEDGASVSDREESSDWNPDEPRGRKRRAADDDESDGEPGSNPSSDDDMRSRKRKKYAAELRAGRAVRIVSQPLRRETRADAVVVLAGFRSEDCSFLLLPALSPADEQMLRFAGPPNAYPDEPVLRALTALGVVRTNIGCAGYTTHRIVAVFSLVQPEHDMRVFVINCVPSLLVDE